MGLIGHLKTVLGPKESARRIKIAEQLLDKDYPASRYDAETRRTQAWCYLCLILGFPQHGVRDFAKHSDANFRKKFINAQLKKGTIPPVPPKA